MSAQIAAQGAALVGLYLEGHPRSLVLQHSDLSSYVSNEPYLGSIVGRFSNRISGASFEIENEACQLDKNWIGKHCLHGGRSGISHMEWRVSAHTETSVTLEIIDQESTSGFPGDCDISVTYSISDAEELSIDIFAVCSKPSPISITAHPYFNLGCGDSISDHQLLIMADHYLPADEELMPTGTIEKVAGTNFDFRLPRRMSEMAYDHNFCVARTGDTMKRMAMVSSEETGIRMELWSNECGLQFYNGGGLNGEFRKYQGFCLEPQAWPDSPNQSNFPNCIISPCKPYRHKISYRFERV